MPKKNTTKKHITITDLYKQSIHGVTFTLLKRVLGAKLYGSSNDVEIRVNFEGNVKKLWLPLEELKEFRDNVDFLYKVTKEKSDI